MPIIQPLTSIHPKRQKGTSIATNYQTIQSTTHRRMLHRCVWGVCSHETGSWVSARTEEATTTTSQQAEVRTIQISKAINIPNQNEEANESRQTDSRHETARVGCGLSKGREGVVSLSNEHKGVWSSPPWPHYGIGSTVRLPALSW